MISLATVLWRTAPGSFELTGWGWVALLVVLGTVEEFARRNK